MALFEEGHPHAGGGAIAWRQNLSRTWGLNASFTLMRSLDRREEHLHHDAVVWIGAEHGFGPQDEGAPFRLLGAVGGGCHGFSGAGAFSRRLGTAQDSGTGNAKRTWFFASEVQVCVTSVVMFSVGFGFGL